ncbi:MAG: peptide deformylase [Acidobacteria bacterium]|nr:peptide deformylase [Acidobacteriota bacterium]
MPVRPILRYGASTLMTPSEPIEDFSRNWQELVDDMVATMYAAPGVGLAAPQIGVAVRLMVIDITVGETDGELIVMANPEILESEGSQSEEEGCLSVPGYSGVTRRAQWVRVRGQRLDGSHYEMEGEGLLARAFAHEVDHLNGRLFLDRLGVLKRDLIVRKLRRRMRRGDW